MKDLSRRAAMGLGLITGPATSAAFAQERTKLVPPIIDVAIAVPIYDGIRPITIGPAAITTSSSRIHRTSHCGCGTTTVRKASSTLPSSSPTTKVSSSSAGGGRLGPRTSRSPSNCNLEMYSCRSSRSILTSGHCPGRTRRSGQDGSGCAPFIRSSQQRSAGRKGSGPARSRPGTATTRYATTADSLDCRRSGRVPVGHAFTPLCSTRTGRRPRSRM